MDFSLLQIPTTVALAGVAVLGYVIGRTRAPQVRAERVSARRDFKRAQNIVHELGRISQHVRNDLAAHDAAVADFQAKIVQFERGSECSWQTLAEEAERVLRPTQRLATQIAHAYDEVRQQANCLMSFTEIRTDALTGLCNRRALDESLLNHLAMNARYGAPFSIAIFDIDHFKKINDEQGHLAGDQALQQLALLLQQSARETDVVSRFGGEEFVIILPNTDLAGACIFAERLRCRVAELSPLTLSGGVAAAVDGDDPQRLLHRADTALYAAKTAGRDLVFQHLGDSVLPVAKTAAGSERPQHRGQWRATDSAPSERIQTAEQHPAARTGSVKSSVPAPS